MIGRIAGAAVVTAVTFNNVFAGTTGNDALQKAISGTRSVSGAITIYLLRSL